MSWFTPVKHPDEQYFIFGKGGGEKLARELSTRLLGQIPLVMEIGEGSDKGLNIYNQNNTSIIDSFEKIVGRIIEIIEMRI